MIDRRVELEGHIARIDMALESGETTGSEVASLLRERRITVTELASIGQPVGSKIDEVKLRRESRRRGVAKSAASSS
jgi:recombinational DNA repair protein RecR